MSAALEAQVAELRARVEGLEAARAMPAAPGLGMNLFLRAKHERIVQLIAEEWRVDPADVVGLIREGWIVQPRFAAVWLAHKLLNQSLPQLGRLFGRDHSTIVHALKRAEGWRIADDDFRAVTDRVLSALMVEFTQGTRS